jgi:hypothetical protein
LKRILELREEFRNELQKIRPFANFTEFLAIQAGDKKLMGKHLCISFAGLKLTSEEQNEVLTLFLKYWGNYSRMKIEQSGYVTPEEGRKNLQNPETIPIFYVRIEYLD